MSSSRNYLPVAKNIYQVRLPLPFALNSVNCYLLRGDEGWTILDTGLNIPQAQAAWRNVFNQLGIHLGDINKIVLTHTHPDHYGLAGWLQELCRNRAGATPPVYMSAQEAKLAHLHWGSAETWKRLALTFWRSCGVPVELAMPLIAASNQTRLRVLPHPTKVEIIEAGRLVQMGGRPFRAIHMPGHSDGHLLFYDDRDRLLLSGDHVLLQISSHIGVWPRGEPDPLGHYLASLEKLSAMNVRMALPGHGVVMTDLPGRIAEMKRHHANRLADTITAVQSKATVFDASRRLFDFNRLDVHEKRFAIAETLAHLEYLRRRQRLRREESGLWTYCPV